MTFYHFLYSPEWVIYQLGCVGFAKSRYAPSIVHILLVLKLGFLKEHVDPVMEWHFSSVGGQVIMHQLVRLGMRWEIHHIHTYSNWGQELLLLLLLFTFISIYFMLNLLPSHKFCFFSFFWDIFFFCATSSSGLGTICSFSVRIISMWQGELMYRLILPWAL